MRTHALIAGLALIAGPAAFSTSAFAADTQLLNLVMPDAKVMAGVNVTNALISPLGVYIVNQISATHGPALNDVTATLGFDPRHDVSEILVASSAAGQDGLILARGTFNPEKISAAAAKDAHATVQQYGGATLVATANGKLTHAVAFLGNSIAVAGDTASVKAALDRNAKVNSIDPALATRVQQLSTSEDAWTVSMASFSALIPNLGGASPVQGPGAQAFQIFKDVQQSSGGVKLGANIEITGQAITSDPKNASALSDLIKLFAGLATMAGGNDPNVAAAAKLLQQLQVSAQGTEVNVALSVPEAQVEELLKAAQPHGQVRDKL